MTPVKELAIFHLEEAAIDDQVCLGFPAHRRDRSDSAIPATRVDHRHVQDARVGAKDMTLDDVRTVKEVVDKLGADKVRQLAEVLGG